MLFKRTITGSVVPEEEIPPEEIPTQLSGGGIELIIEPSGTLSGSVSGTISGTFSGTIDSQIYLNEPVLRTIDGNISGTLSGTISNPENLITIVPSGTIEYSGSNQDYYLINTLTGLSRQKTYNDRININYNKVYIEDFLEKKVYIKFSTYDTKAKKIVAFPKISETLKIQKFQDLTSEFEIEPEQIVVNTDDIIEFKPKFVPNTTGIRKTTFNIKSNEKYVYSNKAQTRSSQFVKINCQGTAYRKFELGYPIGTRLDSDIPKYYNFGNSFLYESVTKLLILITETTSLSGTLGNVTVDKSGSDGYMFSFEPVYQEMTVGEYPFKTIDVTISPTGTVGTKNATIVLSSSNGSVKQIKATTTIYKALDLILPISASGDNSDPRIQFGNIYKNITTTRILGLNAASTGRIGAKYALNLSTDNPSFTVEPENLEFTVGQISYITCSVTPTTKGNLNAYLLVSSSYPDESQNIRLTANSKEQVVISEPIQNLYISMGTTYLGQNWNQTITFEATGLSGAVGSYVLISDNPLFIFSEGSQQQFNISPGETKDIVVTYTPDSVGSKTAYITLFNITENRIEYNDDRIRISTLTALPNNSLGINLTTGLINFPETPILTTSSQNLQIYVSGSPSVAETLTITDNSNEFRISPNILTISGDNTYNVDVYFEPTSTGTKSTTFNLSSSGGDRQTILAEGFASSAPLVLNLNTGSISFSETMIGVSSQQTFIVTASGATNKTETITITDDSNEFSFSPSSFSIAGGNSRTITASFTPTTPAGLKSAIATVSASGGSIVTLNVNGDSYADTPLVLSLNTDSISFSETMIGTSSQTTFAVTASGRSDKTEIVTITDNSNQFSFLPSSFNISGSEFVIITGTFTPIAPAGLKSGITTLSASGGSIITLNVNGDSYADTPLTLNANTSSLIFTNTYVNSSSALILTVSASGRQTRGETITLSDNSDQFGFSPSSFSISGSGSQNINVTFGPTTSTGSKAGTLTVTASGGSKLTIPMSGTALGIPLTYTTVNSISFTSTDINKSSSKSFAFTSSGDPWVTETITVTDNSTSFTPLTSSFIMTGNSTKNIGVQFNPTGSAGTKTGTLTLSSSAGYTKSISLTGTGLAVKAQATLNGITYTAKAAGAAGNNIVVTHVTGADYSTAAGIVIQLNANLQTSEIWPEDPNGSYLQAWIGLRAKIKGEQGNLFSLRVTTLDNSNTNPLPANTTVEINTNPSGGINFDVLEGTTSPEDTYAWQVYNALIAAGAQNYVDIEFGGINFYSSSSNSRLGQASRRAFTPQFGNFVNNCSDGATCTFSYRKFNMRNDNSQQYYHLTQNYTSTNNWISINLGPYSYDYQYGLHFEGGTTNSQSTLLTTDTTTNQSLRINLVETSISNIVTYINNTSTYVSASGTGTANPTSMIGSIQLSGGAG